MIVVVGKSIKIFGLVTSIVVVGARPHSGQPVGGSGERNERTAGSHVLINDEFIVILRLHDVGGNRLDDNLCSAV